MPDSDTTTHALLTAIDNLSRRVRQLEAAEPAILHIGAGAPAHNAAEGVLYWDTVGDQLYANDSGAATWTLVGP